MSETKKNTKKVYNFNAIRPAIIAAHNQDNKRPISAEKCEDLNIDVSYFNEWVKDVKRLQTTVESYVDVAYNSKFNTEITEGDIYAKRELIFPKWKEILHCAESEKEQRQLHVNNFDIEALIKFAWTFMPTGVGTALCHMNDTKFRHEVEKLVGCNIAGNEILSNDDRDILDTFNSALKSIDRAQDKLAELDTAEKSVKMKLKELQDVLKTSGASEAVIKLASQGYQNQLIQISEDRKSTSESKAKAEETLHKVSNDAKAIQLRIKYAGK